MHAGLTHARQLNAEASACGHRPGPVPDAAPVRIDWVVTVPCDSPAFPVDLVARLHAAAREAGTASAVAASRSSTSGLDLHPVFALIHIDCLTDLADALQRGERRVRAWLARQGMAIAAFDDATAFTNINTPDQWRAWTAQR